VKFKKINHIKPVFLLLVLFANISFASFTGSVDEKSKHNKFSLKNLSKISKNYSLTYLKGNFRFKSLHEVNQIMNPNGFEINSMVRVEKGTTTFVYPYTYKVRVPKFKTPAPPSLR
jgi:hypothetical protein